MYMHGFNFPLAPREGTCSFLTSLFICEAKGEGEGRSLKAICGQTSKMESLSLLNKATFIFLSFLLNNGLTISLINILKGIRNKIFQ